MTSDPWEQLDDLDGRQKYRILKVSYTATPAEIKKAYRQLARLHHPDKGGDAVQFGKIQAAFETLYPRPTRQVYDDWASQLQFRHSPGGRGSQQRQGGEGALLDELELGGLVCDPLTQLVVLCEVCGRPSTKQCWTCKMPICSFCTLKRHWREGFSLHWPLINSDHMQTRLAKREFEKKRIEDAKRLDQEDPNWRSETELKEVRAFKTAALKMQDRKDRLVCYDYELARFYMWAQTAAYVFLALHLPTGLDEGEVDLQCNEHLLRIQVQGSPPSIERALDGSVDVSQPIESFKTQDNRLLAVRLPKRRLGEVWPRLFRGDSDGVRCMQPLYRISGKAHFNLFVTNF